MSDPWVTIPAEQGAFKAYVAEPAGAARGAVVVIQEIFGVNAVMRGKCDWLAREGFYAIAPDLFWRLQPGVDITDQSDAEWAQAMDYMKRFDVDAGVEDIRRTFAWVRRERRGEKVGALGYCLGGLLAYLTACRIEADAVVSYHGVMIERRLDEAKGLKAPLLMHLAGKDQFVPPPAAKTIHEALDGRPDVMIFDYPEQDHAFTREGGAHYDAHAAELADGRSIAFLRQHLSA